MRFFKNKKLYKYLDQFSFSFINIGTILFISNFLEISSSYRYVLVNLYSSFSSIIISSFIITPFFIFSTSIDSRVFHFKFSVFQTVLISFIIGVVSAFSHLFVYFSYFDFFSIVFLSIFYSFFDFLRKSFYVFGKEYISGFLSFFLALSIFSFYVFFVMVGVLSYKYYMILLITLLVFFCFFALFLSFSCNKHETYYCELSGNIVFYVKKYFQMGKWSVLSFIFFWMASQGVFIFFAESIGEQELVFLRVFFSLTGVLSVYFAANENKLMVVFRSLYLDSKINEMRILRNRYIVKGFVFSVIVVFFIFNFLYLFQNYFSERKMIFVFFVFSLFQIISGLFRVNAIILKVAMRNDFVFYANAISFILSLMLMLFDMEPLNLMVLIILINGILTAGFYFYFLNRCKIFYE